MIFLDMEKLLNNVCGFIDNEYKIFETSDMEKEYNALHFLPASGDGEFLNGMDKTTIRAAPVLRS